METVHSDRLNILKLSQDRIDLALIDKHVGRHLIGTELDRAAAAELDGLTVVITSNGILRYMYNALTGPDADVKVKTGNTCAVDISGDSGTRLFWNEKPNAELIKSTLG